MSRHNVYGNHTREIEDYKHEEMRAEAHEYYKTQMWEEFEQSYTDFEVAKEFVNNGDESMTLEEFKEMLFDEYCELRD